MLAAALALALATLSYSPLDPSLNTATPDAALNLAGPAGALAADVLLQALGLASAAVIAVMATWSWRIVRGKGLPHFPRHLIVLPTAVFVAAALAAAFETPGAWPLQTGLGGYAGTFLLNILLELVPGGRLDPGGWPVILVLGAITFCSLLLTLGIPPREWLAAGRKLLRLARATAAATAFAAGQAWRAGFWLARRLGAARRGAVELGGDMVDDSPIPELPKPGRSPRGRVGRGPSRLKTGERARREAQPALDLGADGQYQLPPLGLLAAPEAGEHKEKINKDALEQNARLLETVLEEYGVQGEITQVRPGPVVTLYELEPAPGIKIKRVIGLADDIARSMSAVSARIAVIPGRNAIGIELPNATRETVYLGELLATPDFEKGVAKLPLALGKDISGAPVFADLVSMPHLLIAGTTGSGKSVAVNAMILSLLYRLGPDDCKFIMIDPKMLELSLYDGIPHLLTPVVTDPSKAVVALKWTVAEMEERYRAMSKLSVRNIISYNQRLATARKKGEVLKRTVQTGFDAESGEPVYEDQELDLSPLPYIVVVVDEMADLMLVAGKDLETAVQRLSQMARAAGIHLIMATQRPSVDVITGTIKANFPTRVSFQVTSKIDSRTILGDDGAEQLLGMGDMLYMAGGGRTIRVHGPFVSDDEIERVVATIKAQGRPDYLEDVTAEPEEEFGVDGPGGPAADELYDQAVAMVAREGKASTSFVQRHFQIGYNRAARIIEMMEAQGVVSKPSRAGKREVLVGDHG